MEATQPAPNRIRELREQKNMSQRKAAQLMDLPQNSLSQIERRIRDPKLRTCLRIARALDCTLDAIWPTNGAV